MFRKRRLDRGTGVGSVPELFSNQPNTIFLILKAENKELYLYCLL